MTDLIFEWMFIGMIMIAMIYLVVFAIYVAILLIRIAQEEFKK